MTYKYVAPSRVVSNPQNLKEGDFDEFGTRVDANRFANQFTAEDVKAMGLPSRIKAENVRFRANDPNSKILDIYDELGNNKWVRVGSQIQEDGTLKALDKEYGVDKTNFQAAAPIIALASSLIPGVGAAVGKGIFGLSGAAASIAGGATIGGVTSGLSGGNIVKGALVGGLGGASGAISSGLQGVGLGESAAKLVTKGLIGTGKAVIQGGDPIRGALMASIPGLNTGNTHLDGVLNLLMKTGIQNNLSGSSSSSSKKTPTNPILSRAGG